MLFFNAAKAKLIDSSFHVARNQIFTIKLVLNQLFPDEQSKINGLSKQQFDKLLKWTCKKTTLQFNQNYYHQLDGLAMGSPLAPAMADICMNWLTNEVLAKIKNPPVIMRYVDDLFLALDNPNDIEYVLYIKYSTPFIQI